MQIIECKLEPQLVIVVDTDSWLILGLVVVGVVRATLAVVAVVVFSISSRSASKRKVRCGGVVSSGAILARLLNLVVSGHLFIHKIFKCFIYPQAIVTIGCGCVCL